MNCARCRESNPAGFSYCGQCGSTQPVLPENRCKWCFRSIEATNGPCKCTRRSTEPPIPDTLRTGTVLKRRYVMSSVWGQSSDAVLYLAYDLQHGRRVGLQEFFPKHLCIRNGRAVEPSVAQDPSELPPIEARYLLKLGKEGAGQWIISGDGDRYWKNKGNRQGELRPNY